MPIKYEKGDATEPQGEGNKLIIHVVNDIGRFGSGFALAVLKRYPKVKEEYLKAFSSFNPLKLGDVQFVQVANDVWFANMVGQHGVVGPSNPIPIKYDALTECLKKVCDFALEHNMKIYAPRFGAGLARGNWQTIESIINKELIEHNVDITIYDL